MKSVIRWVCLAFALSTPVAASQNIYASFTGAVTDESGGVIPGATVTALNIGTGFTRSAVTSDNGSYRITLLPVGEYSIAVELSGFKKELRTGIILQVDQVGRADFRLTVGDLSETVEIRGTAPLVASETSGVGNVIDSTKVAELPLNGRDFKDLALLVPNAVPTGQGTTHSTRGGFNVAGAREVSNNFLLDGIDNNDPTVNLFTLKPSLEIVQEFKIQTNSYAAESGRYAGGQVNIMTKSGTNTRHGSAFEFFRDERFDSKNFFDNPDAPIPPFSRNQFGGSFGGPILRNKTHFFTGYEGVRITRSETLLASVPTAQFLNGDFSALLVDGNPWTRTPRALVDPLTRQPFAGNIIPPARIHAVSRQVAAMYPAPNRSADPIANFISNPVATDDSNQYSVRVDHQLRQAISLFGRYSLSQQDILDVFDHFHQPTRLPGWGRVEPTKTQHAVVNTSFVLSSRMVNELRLGFNRFQQTRSAINNDDGVSALGIRGLDPRASTGLNSGFPLFSITGYDAIGSSAGQPQQRTDSTFQIVNNLSYLRGNHSLKAGVDLLKFQEFDIINSNIRGNFSFNGQYSGFGLADFLLGVPNQTSRLILPEEYRYMEHYAHGLYIQDDWRILPNLTLNLGVRYEHDGPLRDVHNRVGRFDPVRNQLVLARVKDPRFDPNGALKPLVDLYYPSDKTPIVYRDADTAWDTDHDNFAPRAGLAWRPFNDNKSVVRAGYGIFYDGMVVGNGFAGFGPSIVPFRFGQTFRGALAPNAPDITLNDPFPSTVVLPALSPAAIGDTYVMPYYHQYNVGIEREVAPTLVVEIGYVASRGTHLSRSRNINQAVPGPGSVDSRRPYPWFGTISRRESTASSEYNSLQVRVEKRYSHGVSFLSSYTFGKSIDDDSGSEGAGGAGPQNSYDLEANRGLSTFDVRHRYSLSFNVDVPVGAGQRFGSDWPAFARHVLGGWAVAGIWTMSSGRPITVLFSGDNSGTGQGADRPDVIGDPNLPSDQRSITQWFNTAAFVMPARGQFGNAGRGIIEGPGYKNVDFSLKKDHRFRGRHSIQFRAEFFNVFNHVNFEYPDRTINSARFGRIFGAGTARQMQFGVRYAF